jgi:hypothetical protein
MTGSRSILTLGGRTHAPAFPASLEARVSGFVRTEPLPA